MHFSKRYSELLLTLPSNLRNSAVEYRRLKKLIRELVAELETLGLSPLVLQELLQKSTEGRSGWLSGSASSRGRTRERQLPLRAEVEGVSQSLSSGSTSMPGQPSPPTRVVYELSDQGESRDIVPRLRLWVEESRFPSSPLKVVAEDLNAPDNVNLSTPFASPIALPTASLSIPTTQSQYISPLAKCTEDNTMVTTFPVTQHPHRWRVQECFAIDAHVSRPADDHINSIAVKALNNAEIVIPLTSDIAFFRLLTSALNAVSVSLSACQGELIASIQALSTIVANTSRPASVRGQSDLYKWRSIFRLYMEAQVFVSTSEHDRGERSVEDAEVRLFRFAHAVGEDEFSFKLNDSRDGLKRFLELNVRLIEIKKFQTANTEAVRKILKKHGKRTALPLPASTSEFIPALKSTCSVAHVLVVALTETLMPIVPHIDDYICLICTAIAFKPIRLSCGHLFCVRCLVKMQKRGQNHCPLCRAPTVLSADQSNVDHALVNFMLDWFSRETREKDKGNRKEAAKEELQELGLDTRCIMM